MKKMALRAENSVREWFRSLRMGQRITLLYILAVLVPLFITNLYANSTLNNSAHESQIMAAERGFEQTASVLNERFYRILRMCDVIALDRTLNECLYEHDPLTYSLTAQVADMNTILTFLTQKKDDLDIYNINLYVRDEWIYSKRAEMVSGLEAASTHAWYGALMETNLQAVFCPPWMTEREDILSCARRVRNLENLNNVEAVLRIDFPLEEIERVLLQGSVTEGSVSMLMTEEGSIVASSAQLPPNIAAFPSLAATAGAHKGFITLDERYLAQCAPVTSSGWYLVTLLSRDAMTRASIFAWCGVTLLILIAALPTVMIAQIIMRSMTGRLQKLGEHMQNVRLGALEPTEHDVNHDEIGAMTDSYNYMIERMQSLLDEQYSIGQEARSAELLALQSQINPHFLYNTLDMLHWMARKHHTDEIQTVIKALANFYRTSLSGGRDVVALADELRLIESYMTIQHMRFGGDVTWHIDVSEEAMRCELPKITLQPIVENALLHGILPKEDKRGVITLRGRVEEGNVVVDIEDDGIGMPAGYVDTMLLPGNPNRQRRGYGLYNIEKRLCLMFSLTRCISIESCPEKGTRVRILFPARPASML